MVRVFLLGKFEVSRAEKVLRPQDWTRRKAATLFQRLAYERRLIKDQVIDFLWPESDATSGSNNLYRLPGSGKLWLFIKGISCRMNAMRIGRCSPGKLCSGFAGKPALRWPGATWTGVIFPLRLGCSSPCWQAIRLTSWCIAS